MAMNTDIYENGRPPEFIERMIGAARKLQNLRDQIRRHEITLDAAAKQVNDAPDWHGNLAEARRYIALGLED
jgi:hypothetical protein